jgi:RNA polymerase sigma-70 factor (ECF subfamily)
MLAIYRTRDVFRFDPKRGRFRDWLFGIVRNTIARRRRSPADRLAGRGGEENAATLENRAEDSADRPDEQWEMSFEISVLGAMLDVVRREVSPRVYQAFELSTLHQLPAVEVAMLTGQTRSAVYQAKSRVMRQLRQMGLSFRTRGERDESLRGIVEAEPPASLQQRLSQRTHLTMISRFEEKEEDDAADD